MTNTATWNDVQRRVAQPGSRILTQWRAEREAARAATNVTYSESVYEAFGALPTASGESVTHLSAMRVSWAARCAQIISSTIATLPVQQYRRTDDADEELPRDDLWFKLNEQPHEQMTAASHWEGVGLHILHRGDGYTWIRRRPNNSVRELLPMPWGSTYPFRQPDGSVRYYVSLPEFGITTWLDAEDVLHFPGFGFDMHTLRSYSVIAYNARTAVGNAQAMDKYAGKFFEGGAHPSIILKSPHRMDERQKDEMREAFVAKYAGMGNAHQRPLVLTEGVEAEAISITPEDSQLMDARKWTANEIACAYGVPPHMIGVTNGASAVGAGYEEQGRNFVTFTMTPHLVRIEQELNRKLFPRDSGRFLRFDRDALIEGNSKTQADYFRAALGGPGSGAGWMSQNEVRRRKGLKKMPGGDQLFDPSKVQKDGNASPPAPQ